MFESGVVKPSDGLNFTVKFDDIIEMQEGIKKVIQGDMSVKTSGTYEINIQINSESSDSLYKVDARFKNSRGEEYSKYIYVFKQ